MNLWFVNFGTMTAQAIDLPSEPTEDDPLIRGTLTGSGLWVRAATGNDAIIAALDLRTLARQEGLPVTNALGEHPAVLQRGGYRADLSSSWAKPTGGYVVYIFEAIP